MQWLVYSIREDDKYSSRTVEADTWEGARKEYKEVGWYEFVHAEPKSEAIAAGYADDKPELREWIEKRVEFLMGDRQTVTAAEPKRAGKPRIVLAQEFVAGLSQAELAERAWKAVQDMCKD